MKKFKYQNTKEKTKVLNDIYDEMMENLGIEEITRYVKEFPREKDYNIVQYGNLLIYYYDIRNFLIDSGFTKFGEKRTTKARENEYKKSDFEVWEYYKYLVGIVARYIVYTPEYIKEVEEE